MTCILGMHLRGVAYMAADSLTTCTTTVAPVTARKINRFGPWVLGAAGPGEILHNLLRARGEYIADSSTADQVLTIVREAVRDAGWQPKTEPGGLPSWEVGLLVAGPDGLHESSGYLRAESIDEGKVAGEGSSALLGMAAATAALLLGQAPAAALRLGVEVACALDLRSGGQIFEERVAFGPADRGPGTILAELALRVGGS